MDKRVNILGVGFDNLTLKQAGERAYAMTEEPRVHRIVTPNSEIVYMARKDARLKELLNTSDLVVPDGIGVVYASKIVGEPLREKVAGIDLGDELMARLARHGKSLYLLGAKPGVAELCAQKLVEKHPGLVIAGVHDGYFQDDAPVVADINASGAQALFVCLGAPKQEKWMADNAGALTSVRVMLGLGGSLDAYAGLVKRAPDIWIKLGLEWLYRLIKEPSRFGRMLALPKFMLAVIFRRKGRT